MKNKQQLTDSSVNFITKTLADENNHAVLLVIVQKDGNIMNMPAASSKEGVEHLMAYLPSLPKQVMDTVLEEPQIKADTRETVH